MLDVIEIDGASNNGVDNVRDLIEKARFEPTQWKFKIYIIDEVHMLSDGAFNALLKIIEEPPKHVKFILATTEIDKVPDTIQSRALRFDFEKIQKDDIVARLEYVVKEEGIKATKEALEVIAESAQGWMRDALTILEQQSIASEIDITVLKENLAILDASLIIDLVDILLTGDEVRFEHTLETLTKKHIRIEHFFNQMLREIRKRMFAKEHLGDFHEYDAISSLIESAYTKIKFIPDTMLLLEITLLRILRRNGKKPSWRIGEDIKPPQKRIEISEPVKVPEPKKEMEKTLPSPLPTLEPIKKQEPSESQGAWEIIKWKDTVQENSAVAEIKANNEGDFSYILLLNHLKETKPALTTDLKSARFEVSEQKLTLIFEKEWNFGRVNTPTIKNLFVEGLEKLFGIWWVVECQLWSNRSISVDEVF